MKVRRASPEDVPVLGRIYLQALRDTYNELLPEEYFASLTPEEGEAVWRRAAWAGGLGGGAGWPGGGSRGL